MDIRRLRYFVETVQEGSISAAARKLFVSQPSLSRQVRELEDELGMELFHRSRGRLQLTPVGRQFLPLARDIVARTERAKRTARNLATGHLDRIIMAAPITTLTDVVAPFVATFPDDYPTPSIVEYKPATSLDELLLDVDVCYTSRHRGEGLNERYIITFPVWAYVKPDHAWAGRGSIDVEELVSQPIIVSTKASKSRRVFESALEMRGLAAGCVIEASNGRIAQALAAAGRGHAVVTNDPEFGLVPLHITSHEALLKVPVYGYWRADHHATDTLDAISRELGRFCRERYGYD